MHYLITGGQGYIGNYLTRALLDECNIATTLDLNLTAKDFDFSKYPRNKLIRHQASVTNPDVVYRSMDGIDAIYHLAGRSDFENTYRHPMRLVQSNVEGTTNLCCMANRAGVNKIIFASTTHVYGNFVGAKEDDPTLPLNTYGASKLAAEHILRAFYQKGMEVIILRISTTWGKKNDFSIISKFVKGQKTIWGDGQQSRDFVFIDDVISALKAAKDWDSGIYNIGSGEETSINGLWNIINPNEEPKYVDYPVGYDEPFRSSPDISLVSELWKPKTLLSNLSREDIVCELSL